MGIILTMEAFLEALLVDPEASNNKTSAKVFHNPPETIEVKEFFDNGKEDPNSDSLVRSGVHPEIFDTALKAGYIQKAQYAGGFLLKDFVITEKGKEQLVKIKRRNKTGKPF